MGRLTLERFREHWETRDAGDHLPTSFNQRQFTANEFIELYPDQPRSDPNDQWGRAYGYKPMRFPLVVPSSSSESITWAALDCEGLSPAGVICAEECDYAQLFTHLWGSGDGFIMVEHDVVPWPGAIEILDQCDHDWCRYKYPYGAFGELAGTIGCSKFSAALTSRVDLGLPEDTNWQFVDRYVYAALAEAEEPCHVHWPAVAHARSYEPRTRITEV